jgi:sulfate/thiosulfate transport system substrate-binding protein
MKVRQLSRKRWASSFAALRSGRRFVSLFLVGAFLSFAIAACGGENLASNSANSKEVELTLIGYAIPKVAHDAILPKFVEKWQKEKGQTVTVRQSYGGSGAQTRAIIDGLEADIAHLALAADTEKLVKAGFVNADWQTKIPNNGTVAKTVVAIIVRPGNPKNIKSFADLARNDVKWVTPDPKTSGGARWNFIALWDYALKTNNKDEAKAKEFVTKAYKNVAVLAKDAREATDAFAKQGQGDALINYENEVILAKQKGEKLDYVVPDINVSVDTPISVIDQNVDRKGNRAVAEALTQFFFTPEAQAEFVKLGFRPANEATAKPKQNAEKYAPVKTLSTIKDFGGWEAVQQKFFEDGAIFDQVVTRQ